MSGGAEFLFWLIFFGIIGVGCIGVEIHERRKNPKSHWLKKFDERVSK